MKLKIFILLLFAMPLLAQDMVGVTFKKDITWTPSPELHQKIKIKLDKGQYSTSNPRLYLPKEYKLKKNRTYAYVDGRWVEYRVLGNGNIQLRSTQAKYHSYNFKTKQYRELDGDDSYVRPANVAAKIKKLKDK